MTRFGEISPLSQNLKALGQFLMVAWVSSKILNLLWLILYDVGTIFIVVPKWLNMEDIIKPSGHTDHDRDSNHGFPTV